MRDQQICGEKGDDEEMKKLRYVPRVGILLFVVTFSVLSSTIKPINGLPQPNQSWAIIGAGVIKTNGAYDNAIFGLPTAIQDGTKFDVWYTGQGSDKIYRIGYAYSTDRVTFTQTPGVIAPTETWESGGVEAPSVVHKGSIYSIWYTGVSTSGISGGIGVVWSTSPTGPWTKSSIPVLVASQPWEDGQIFAATVLWDQQAGIYRMWYSGGNTQNAPGKIGYAVSLDGLFWSKYFANPVLSPNTDGSEGSMVAGPTVVKVGGLFWMWYSTTAGIRSAYSLDGIIWTKWYQTAIPPTASYPSVFPWFDEKTGQLRLGMYFGLGSVNYAQSNLGLGTAPLFMNPPIGETYFINGDPSRSQYTAYDSLSAGILYGSQPAFVNHYMGFDTNAAWATQTGTSKGKLLLNGQWVVTLGGPLANSVVGYYEMTAQVTPVYYAFKNGQCQFVDRKNLGVVAQLSPSLAEHEDYMVMEQFSADSNNIMMIYGFGWKGTWAGGIYFKDYFWTHSYQFVGYNYVILHWIDSNNDGNPQANEITAFATG